jgi:hypothetical protein
MKKKRACVMELSLARRAESEVALVADDEASVQCLHEPAAVFLRALCEPSVYLYIYIHTYIYVLYIYIYVLYIYIYIYIYILYIYICMYICIYVYNVCVCVCVCIMSCRGQ